METGKDCVANTLTSLYDTTAKSNNGHGMWNDQPANGNAASAGYAHSKGVVHFDDEQGFYLIHSVPNYPDDKATGYKLLPTYKFGQSYMCLTLPTEEFEELGKDLMTMHVKFYDSEITDDLASKLPSLVQAMDSVEDKENLTRKTSFTTVGGTSFTHYAKGRKAMMALYEEFVSQDLDIDLACETWQNGAFDNVMPTYCPDKDHNHTIANVLSVKQGDVEWKETQDHSKWAVSTKGFEMDTGSHAIACIGGINRQESQEKRGGATMCAENKDLNNALFEGIVDFEDCPAP